MAWPEDPDLCQTRVHRLCRKLLSSAEEAQEVAQNVMLNLHRSLGSFQGRCKWSTWVYQVTLNSVRSFRRSRMYERRRTEDSDVPFEQVPDAELAPSEAVSRDEMARMVQDALAQLPHEQREALILRNEENLSYQEIAALIGSPVGTVKSRVHNGLVRLGRSLQARMRV